MRKEIVDNFNGLKCSRCKKALDNETQIVDSKDLVGRYLCLPCFHARNKEIMQANRSLL